MDARGARYAYEPYNIEFTPPSKKRRYKPDFILANGIIVEAKGYFKPKDRTKHLDIKASRPDLDVRFLFQRADTKLSKRSSTTYGDWCDKHGFAWAEGRVPQKWINAKKKKA